MSAFKVAYILLHFPYLTETFVAEEIQALREQGIDVQIISLLEPGSGPIHPISEQLVKNTWYAPNMSSWQLWWAQFYFLTRSPHHYFRLLSQLLRQSYPRQPFVLFLKRLVIFLKAVAVAHKLKDTSINIIHAHFAWLSGAAARVISTLLNLPFTVTIHAYDIYSISNDLLCFTTRTANKIIAISEFNKQTVLEMCPHVKEKAVTIIHCGIDLDLFHPSARTNSKPLSILAVGSLTPKKGYKYLIQACQQLKDKAIDFRCTIIGGGEEENSLKQLISEYDLEEMVTLKGPCRQPEVLQAYREHDLFALACVILSDGDRDGIPVVFMEAMAMQMPVLSTTVSGIPELVRHKETGWLVPERDSTAIAEAIIQLAPDQALREQLGHNGRELVKSEFGIRGNAAKLAQVFRQINAEREESSNQI